MFKSIKNCELVNLINYMTCTARGTFYGFFPIPNESYWGIEIGNKTYAACFIQDQSKTQKSDDERAERAEGIALENERFLPVLFYGSDNTSYIMRFKTVEERTKFLEETTEFNPEVHQCFWYNS